jgi:hypothetical protein
VSASAPPITANSISRRSGGRSIPSTCPITEAAEWSPRDARYRAPAAPNRAPCHPVRTPSAPGPTACLARRAPAEASRHWHGGRRLAHSETRILAACARHPCLWSMSGFVKGFRTPASHWHDEILGGRRPKSLKGGNRGGVCTGSGVGLWGFGAGVCADLRVTNWDDG